MELKEKTKYDMSTISVTEYMVSDGLNVEKAANYVSQLVGEGFVFKRAKITTSADKDSHDGSYGDADYDNLPEFMSSLKQGWVQQAQGAGITVVGTDAEAKDLTVSFYIDRNEVAVMRPIVKEEAVVKYFKREHGGIVRLTGKHTTHYLSQQGEWIARQDLISMFVDGMVDYEEITEAQVEKIINEVSPRQDEVQSRVR